MERVKVTGFKGLKKLKARKYPVTSILKTLPPPYGEMILKGDSLDDIKNFYLKNISRPDVILKYIGAKLDKLGITANEERGDRRNYETVRNPHMISSIWIFALIRNDLSFGNGVPPGEEETDETGWYHVFVDRQKIGDSHLQETQKSMFPTLGEVFLLRSRINGKPKWYKCIMIKYYEYKTIKRIYDCAKIYVCYANQQDIDKTLDSIQSGSYQNEYSMRNEQAQFTLKELKLLPPKK